LTHVVCVQRGSVAHLGGCGSHPVYKLGDRDRAVAVCIHRPEEPPQLGVGPLVRLELALLPDRAAELLLVEFTLAQSLLS